MDDQQDQYPNSVSFRAGCAVEHDYIYVASYADALDPDETHFSRMFTYVGRIPGNDKWYHHDLETSVVSVCVKKASAHDGRRLCALSKNGEVELFSNIDGSSIIEQIDGAGLINGTRGYLQEIREIGQSLVACGVNNQVYRRQANGTWALLNGSGLELRTQLEDITMLNSIDGTSESDIYTCGLQGQLYHFDGRKWTRLVLRTDENLNCVRCVSTKEVWVCGKNGTLLVGNAVDGFKDVSSIDDNQAFWSLTKFKGIVYVSSLDAGLFAYDGKSISEVDTGFASGLWVYELDSVPETLWSFSPKEIASFDGLAWKRVHHPDNDPIVD